MSDLHDPGFLNMLPGGSPAWNVGATPRHRRQHSSFPSRRAQAPQPRRSPNPPVSGSQGPHCSRKPIAPIFTHPFMESTLAAVRRCCRHQTRDVGATCTKDG